MILKVRQKPPVKSVAVAYTRIDIAGDNFLAIAAIKPDNIIRIRCPYGLYSWDLSPALAKELYKAIKKAQKALEK